MTTMQVRPPTPVRRYLSAEQLRQVTALFEAILPKGASNPGATECGAADYLDLMLGSPDSTYYEIPEWRALYTAGLAMLTAAALADAALGKPLDQLTTAQITTLLTQLAAGQLRGFPGPQWQTRFFTVMRGHCIEGCFSDPHWGGNRDARMWRWLGYPYAV